jgi:hypothetical protein
VHSIVLELPVAMISQGSNILGAYGSTSRPHTTVRGEARGSRIVQVQRLANPLVNEVIIGTADKALPIGFPFLAAPWDGRDRIHLNP